jgi:hypothetical protein
MAFNLKTAQQQQMPLAGPAQGLIEWYMQTHQVDPGTPPEEVLELAEQAQAEAAQANQVATMIQENLELQQEQAEQSSDMLNMVPEAMPAIQNTIQGSKNMTTFNLKKAQYDMEPVAPGGDVGADIVDSGQQQYDMMEEEQQQLPLPKFSTGSELAQWLDQLGGEVQARTELSQYGVNLDAIKEDLELFFSGMLNANSKEGVANGMLDKLPELKVQEINDPGVIQAPLVQAQMEEISDVIKSLAEKHVKGNRHSFNLKKEAQHKVVEDTFMYGPSQTRIDPFYMMPVSDYHVIERNKGYGLDFGGVWDVDWEAVWRGSIMDKYSRPYKDKEGNWVGGYIQKRFEVDKNIPEQNNLQLKPGQKRRPILPQYGNTESRLEHMRASEDRGYEPVSTGNPTDWNELTTTPFNLKQAASKKKS